MINDEDYARNKTSMGITDNQTVSWDTVKGTILNYVRHHTYGAIPNTVSILDKIEKDNDLSGQNQHTVFKYKNSVSGLVNGIINIFTGTEKWPSSSVFSFVKGNKVILITLNGVIEYDKNDVKKLPNGEVYIRKADAYLFNGAETSVSILPANSDGEQVLDYQQLENCDFTLDDLVFFPAVPENETIRNVSNIKQFNTYSIINHDRIANKTDHYSLSIEGNNGVCLSNLGENSKNFYGTLSNSGDKKNKICTGQFANFMPYGDCTVTYSEIDSSDNSITATSDGIGGIYNNDLSLLNTRHIINTFTKKMALNNNLTETQIINNADKLSTVLLNEYGTNSGENEHDNEIGDRYSIIKTLHGNTNYLRIKQLFNGNYVNQIIKHDDDGNYLFANEDIHSPSPNGNIYEVQLSNGDLFKGKIKFDDSTGEVYFMDGIFLNRNGKVIDNKKQISLKTASSLLYDSNAARDVNDDDLKQFALSDRILIEKDKDQNIYNYTIVGTSFENTIRNNKIHRNYIPSLDYIDRQLAEVEKFINGEIRRLNVADGIYDEYIKNIDSQGFSKSLIKSVRGATKKLYELSVNNLYQLKSGERLTGDAISAFYSQLSQWQYLYSMREKRLALDNKDKISNITKEPKKNLQEEKDNLKKIDTISNEEPKIDEDNEIINDEIKSKKPNKTKKKTDIKDNSHVLPTNKIATPKRPPLEDESAKNVVYPKILSNFDLIPILKDTEANQLAGMSNENSVIFSQLMKNVVETEDKKIELFLKMLEMLYKTRECVTEGGVKYIPLSQNEYEELMQVKNELTRSMTLARSVALSQKVKEYGFDITNEYNVVKEDFNEAKKFALSESERLTKSLHNINCQLFDHLDKNGVIRRCCNDILYERDVNGDTVGSDVYNEYDVQTMLNGNANYNTHYSSLGSGTIDGSLM